MAGGQLESQVVIFHRATFCHLLLPTGREFFPLPPECEISLFPVPEACKILIAVLEEGSKGDRG